MPSTGLTKEKPPNTFAASAHTSAIRQLGALAVLGGACSGSTHGVEFSRGHCGAHEAQAGCVCCKKNTCCGAARRGDCNSWVPKMADVLLGLPLHTKTQRFRIPFCETPRVFQLSGHPRFTLVKSPPPRLKAWQMAYTWLHFPTPGIQNLYLACPPIPRRK